MIRQCEFKRRYDPELGRYVRHQQFERHAKSEPRRREEGIRETREVEEVLRSDAEKITPLPGETPRVEKRAGDSIVRMLRERGKNENSIDFQIQEWVKRFLEK